MKVIAIIPAYNEEQTVGSVVKKSKNYVDEVIVIDDASTDSTADEAKKAGVIIYQHSINRGLGGALGTGIKIALERGADIIVTLDADNQHDPTEIPKLIEPIIHNKADAVIGSRFMARQKVPFKRNLYNKIGNAITFLLFRAKTTDSQSGFRAFNRQAAKIMEIKTNGMEVSSEIIKEIIENNLRLTEVPIKAIYTNYSLSKGQGFLKGVKTLSKLIILKLTK